MSIIMGRDSSASELLEIDDPSVHLAFPSVCFMEAVSANKHQSWLRKDFEEKLRSEITQLERNRTFSAARSLVGHLNQCLITSDRLFKNQKIFFEMILASIAKKSDLIELRPQTIEAGFLARYIDDPTDNLIACCIIDHARAHPAETKAFLSGNTKDFGTEEVRRAFRDAGIDKVFAEAGNALGWLKSLSNP
jgi:hypothetical protein